MAIRHSPLSLVLATAMAALAAAAQQTTPSPPSAAPTVSTNASPRPIQLVLKDGSVQLVRSYQVIGDRVRYYSVDRSQWEEIPAALVDWDATRRAAVAPDTRLETALRLAREVDRSAQPGSLDVDPGLPPGVTLPSEEGLYAWDGQQLRPLQTSLAESKLNKGRFLAQILSPVPVIPTRYTIQLKGAHATTQLASSEPAFFLRQAATAPPALRLLRAHVRGNRRELEWVSSYLGAQQTQAEEIPLRQQRLGPRLYRFQPEQDLPPGEYVLAVALADRGIDLQVWDFAVVSPPAHKR